MNNLYTKGKGINLGNAAKAAVVGGTASVLGGGKFANGATTASFSYLFGEAARNSQKPESRVVAAPNDVKGAVKQTLEGKLGRAVDVDQIKVVENSKWANLLSGITELRTGGDYIILATTQRDTIYLSSHITPSSFLRIRNLCCMNIIM